MVLGLTDIGGMARSLYERPATLHVAAGLAWSSSYMVSHRYRRGEDGSSYQINLCGKIWGTNCAQISMFTSGGL